MAKSVSLLCTISWADTSLYLQVPWDSSCSPTSACKLGNGEQLQETYFLSTKSEWTCFTGPKDPCLKAVLLDLLNYLDPLSCHVSSTSLSGDLDPIGCSWGPGSLTDFLLFQNTKTVTSLLRFWDLRYPFITKITSHPSVSDLGAPSSGPWYIAPNSTPVLRWGISSRPNTYFCVILVSAAMLHLRVCGKIVQQNRLFFSLAILLLLSLQI